MAKTTKKTRNPVQTRSKFYFSHKTLPFRFAIITIPHSLQCFRRGRPPDAPSAASSKSCVGRGALTPPPSMHRTIKPCHCEERSDVAIRTPFAPHLQPMRRGGVLPRLPAPHLQPCPCRAAPMCAAADNRRIPNGGAHWPRPTVVLPTPHPVSRTRRAGCPHPAARRTPHHQTLSLRGAQRRGNPYSFCTAPPTYA